MLWVIDQIFCFCSLDYWWDPAQAILLFIAGYDTTANALCWLMYNLACNPEIQEKVYDEIQEVIGNDVRIKFCCALRISTSTLILSAKFNNWVFYNSSFSAKSSQNPASIGIQRPHPIGCQYWKDSAKWMPTCSKQIKILRIMMDAWLCLSYQNSWRWGKVLCIPNAVLH